MCYTLLMIIKKKAVIIIGLIAFVFLALVPCIPLTVYTGDSGNNKKVSVFDAVIVVLTGAIKPNGDPSRLYR